MRLSPLLALSLALPLAQSQQTIGFKIITQHSSSVGPSETTAYYLPDRSRTEDRISTGYTTPGGSVQTIYGPHTAIIRRCDLGKMFSLNLDSREYSESTDPSVIRANALVAARTDRKSNPAPPLKPTLRIESTVTDTGERKQMFGYTARHVVYTQKYVPLEGSTVIAQETTEDGWYIDIDTQLSCDQKTAPGARAHALVVEAGHKETIEFVDRGTGRLGFPLSMISTLDSLDVPRPARAQKPYDKFSIKVTDLERVPLDPTLFEIPSGFKLVKEINPNPIRPVAQTQPKSLWQRFNLWRSSIF